MGEGEDVLATFVSGQMASLGHQLGHVHLGPRPDRRIIRHRPRASCAPGHDGRRGDGSLPGELSDGFTGHGEDTEPALGTAEAEDSTWARARPLGAGQEREITARLRREVTASLKVGALMLVDEIGRSIFSVSRLVV